MKERKKKTVPSVSLLSTHRVELSFEKGKRRALVEGVKRISDCTKERVALFVSRDKMIFTGKELCTVAYAGGALEITGEIEAVSFACLDDQKG